MVYSRKKSHENKLIYDNKIGKYGSFVYSRAVSFSFNIKNKHDVEIQTCDLD
jgi:hypothetical protein